MSLTNTVSFKDVSGIRVKGIFGQTLRNLIVGGDFPNITGWVSSNATKAVVNGTMEFTATAQYGYVGRVVNIIGGHKYFLRVKAKGASGTPSLLMQLFGNPLFNILSNFTVTTTDAFYSTTLTANASNASAVVIIGDNRASGWDKITIDDFVLIDLTADGLPNATATDINNLAPNYFDGTVSVVNPTIRSQNIDGSKYTDLAITGTLRSVIDSAILYQDKVYNSNGKWFVDRIVDATTGLKLASVVTEPIVVSGMEHIFFLEPVCLLHYDC